MVGGGGEEEVDAGFEAAPGTFRAGAPAAAAAALALAAFAAAVLAAAIAAAVAESGGKPGPATAPLRSPVGDIQELACQRSNSRLASSTETWKGTTRGWRTPRR